MVFFVHKHCITVYNFMKLLLYSDCALCVHFAHTTVPMHLLQNKSNITYDY